MKQRFTVFLVLSILLLAMLLVFSACGTASPTTSVAPTQTGTPVSTPTKTTTTTTAPSGTTAAPTAAKPKPTGTIRVASVDFSYESTDPIFYESFWGWSMYDPLVTWDNQGNYIPAVAESWTLSPDGKTWTFKIRKGIKFHNGDPLTAHDVKFSVDRFASPESTNPWSPYLRNNLDYTEVTDDYTFVYHSKVPEPPLIIPFAWTRIVPKNYMEKVGVEEFRKHPIGSGPWKFVEHVPETRFKMEANTEYWGQVPAYQYVLDLQVPEESTRIALLRRGDVDIALGISTDRLVELHTKEGFKLQAIGDPTLWNINFPGTWVTAKPTRDIRVRQAMSYAINREEIAATFYKGLAKPGGTWFMHPGSYGWDDALLPDPYDPAKAKALLAEAGYPGNFSDTKIKYYVSPGPGVDQAQLLKGYWDAVGIKVDIEIIDAVQWGGMFFVRNVAPNAPNVGNIFPWTFGSTPNSTYHCANMYTSNGVHSTGNDPKADELYKKATTELDFAKARQYWTEFQKYVRGLYITVGIVQIEPLVLVGPGLGEFTSKTHISLADAYAGIQHPK
ncbi:MAG: ABC transporter substrate-binding protein [Dehalococcoidales bacterium]|nr:ABC transporter substrate-binding protein [Dehalococcoidales bacterium]